MSDNKSDKFGYQPENKGYQPKSDGSGTGPAKSGYQPPTSEQAPKPTPPNKE